MCRWWWWWGGAGGEVCKGAGVQVGLNHAVDLDGFEMVSEHR